MGASAEGRPSARCTVPSAIPMWPASSATFQPGRADGSRQADGGWVDSQSRIRSACASTAVPTVLASTRRAIRAPPLSRTGRAGWTRTRSAVPPAGPPARRTRCGSARPRPRPGRRGCRGRSWRPPASHGVMVRPGSGRQPRAGGPRRRPRQGGEPGRRLQERIPLEVVVTTPGGNAEPGAPPRRCEDRRVLETVLASVVGAAHLLTDPDLRAAAEVDWTGRWRGTARAVVRPGTPAEVAEVLAACAAEGVPV